MNLECSPRQARGFSQSPGEIMDATYTPADKLRGVTLGSGWLIGERVAKPAGGTGGSFGVCYHATRGSEAAFVKALDFRMAFRQRDFIAAVNALTSQILWEKEIMELCRDANMSRVVRLLDYQDIILPQDEDDATKKVCCLVFEIGDGDLRSAFNIDKNPRYSWRLRVLRDVALALDQLHRQGVAHLDVKPSNVVSISHTDATPTMKLADLGRSVRKGVPGPFDAIQWPGDSNYRPPEKWYGYKSDQWNDEREAADAYMLGNLFVYLITGLSMNTLLHQRLPDAFKPEAYRGKFDSQLIDVLKHAQAEVLALHVFPALPNFSRDEIETMILDLTNPDPETRGDKKARREGVVGIDRFHQKLHRIAERMSWIEGEARG